MSNKISDALGIDSTALVKTEVVESIPTESILIPQNNNFHSNIDEDYEKSRAYLYKLMDKVDGLLDDSINVAQQSEHPRAFEVASNIVTIASNLTDQLSKLSKSTQNLKGITHTSSPSSVTTNNSIFVGSTSELSAFLNSKKNDDLQT
jgi:hypothetical protein